MKLSKLLLIFTSSFFYLLGVLLGFFYTPILRNIHSLNIFTENININLILLNNVKLVMLLIVGGLLMGSLTTINLVINGQFLGVIIRELITSHDLISTLFILLLFVFPHGVFEIPAIIIAGAAGFKIPYEIVRYLAGRKEQVLTKEDIKEYLTLSLISIILIIIAAFVEAYITPRIAMYFFK